MSNPFATALMNRNVPLPPVKPPQDDDGNIISDEDLGVPANEDEEYKAKLRPILKNAETYDSNQNGLPYADQEMGKGPPALINRDGGISAMDKGTYYPGGTPAPNDPYGGQEESVGNLHDYYLRLGPKVLSGQATPEEKRRFYGILAQHSA